MLRPYQQDAHDAIIAWIRKTKEPCLIEAATGAGKSHIIAALADTVHAMSGGKHILCLAPSKELVEQNFEKYTATGNKASIFSASVGIKNLDHPVVFGTPMSVKNSIDRFGGEFAMVIIDECHGLTPTVLSIIRKMPNPNLRVVGMTATPYRLGQGYIFRSWADGREANEKAWFSRCVYRIQARQLIAMGFLTLPVMGGTNAEGYQTKGMVLNRMGQFSAEDIDRAYHGQGRKTAAIINDIVEQAAGRRGVLIFAATVRHAHECLQSLPPELSAIVTAETPKAERERILRDFKAQRIKYIVNVAVLTTGFDATHVDVVAMLRATESVGLLQQIIGRGLRLHGGKEDCLILDYAENIERHCPDGDVFNPEIEKAREAKNAGEMDCICPMCAVVNSFSARPNPDRYRCDDAGYFVDLDGNRVAGPFGEVPGHFGRRCTATHLVGGNLVRCEYRWTSKDCDTCGHKNDIAARRCEECDKELVDPNEKLRIFFPKKKDPTVRQCEPVLGWKVSHTLSQKGNETIRVAVVTKNRSFAFWVHQRPTFFKARMLKVMFDALRGQPPKTIEYQKDAQSGFYNVFSFNKDADESSP